MLGMEKICKKCNNKFEVESTGKILKNKSKEYLYVENRVVVRSTLCYPCLRQKAKDNWKRNKLSCIKYEKGVNGYLMRMYRNMKSRVTGVQKAKFHLYQGKELLPKEEFYSWAKSSEKFYQLFSQYIESGRDRKLAPSVDRIDSSKGYILGNMEWVTHSENSRRGATKKLSFETTIAII